MIGGEPGASRSTPAGRRRSDVVQRVEDVIVRGRLRPGDPLPTEVDLCEAVGASRSSVREAIRTLCALDLVEVRHGHGTYVGRMSMDPLVESVSFRGRLDRAEGSGLRREVVEVRERLDQSSARGAPGPARRRTRARSCSSASAHWPSSCATSPRAGPRGRRSTGPSTCCWPSRCPTGCMSELTGAFHDIAAAHGGAVPTGHLPCRPHPRRDRRGGRGRATPRRCTPRSPPTTPRCWSQPRRSGRLSAQGRRAPEATTKSRKRAAAGDRAAARRHTSPMSRLAPASRSGTNTASPSTVRPEPVGAGSTATPSPAPTSPSIVARSVLSNAVRGAKPAARQSRSVRARKPNPGCRTMKSSRGRLGQPHRPAPGERVRRGHHQAQPLTLQDAPAEPRVGRTRPGDRQLRLAGVQVVRDGRGRLLAQGEAHGGRLGAVLPQQPRHEGRGDRVQERQAHRAGLRVVELGDLLASSVQRCGRLQGGGEDEPPAGVQPQPAVLPLEQPGAERVLDPAQRARQARLRDAELVRRRRQVLGAGEGDEPAQVLGLHPPTIRFVHRSASLASFHV